ncbi:MAG: hypothetical protein GYB67_03275 [Chloroflexi bacterium]|nr:hypothetical protein [Chloroflexota bacterium]
MQNLTEMTETRRPQQPTEAVADASSTRGELQISVEFIAYVAIAVVALVFRLADLDSVPLSPDEAREALAAWRVVSPEASGPLIAAESPVRFLLQSVMFSLAGASELTARLLTAIGGAVLVLLPGLFRRWIGASGALIFSLLLLISPVALIAARFDSGVVWSVIAALSALWAFLRYYEHRRASDAVLATVMFAALIFLTEPGGPLLALIVIGAIVLGFRLQREQADPDAEAEAVTDQEAADDQPALLAGWPWAIAFTTAALIVFVVSTGFMLYPTGLSNVGELLSGTLRGFAETTITALPLFPLSIAIFYEPLLWILGLIVIVVRTQQGTLSLLDQIFIVWLILAVLASILFTGAEAGHALWLIVPLIGLAMRAVVWLFSYDEEDAILEIPAWARWMIAVLVVAVLVGITTPFQTVARNLLASPDGLLLNVNYDGSSVVLVLVYTAFLIIGYFMVASLWGNRTSLRGVGLGFVIFAAVASLGAGWNAAVVDADNPVEPWHTETTHRDVFLLRDSLLEVDQREAGGLTLMPLVVQAPTDGVIAWVVRDFPNAEFIAVTAEARLEPVALLPQTPTEPDLGAAYVGQDFGVQRTWAWGTLRVIDFSAWWSQRRTRVAPNDTDRAVLWLRQDIYDGIDPQNPASG